LEHKDMTRIFHLRIAAAVVGLALLSTVIKK